MARSFNPCLVHYGAENYMIDQGGALARSLPRRTAVDLDGEEVSGDEIIEQCSTGTLDQSDITVIVDNAHKVKASKALKAFIENLKTGDSSLLLIVLCRSEKLPETWNAAAKWRLQEHPRLKTYDDNNQVVDWIHDESNRQKVKLDKGVAEALYKAIGYDLYALAGEIRKLGYLVPAGDTVTLKQAATVVTPMSPTEAREVCDAVGRRSVEAAMNAVSRVYQTSAQDPTVSIVSSLQRFIERLLVLRQMMDLGASEDAMASAVDTKPYRLKMHWVPMVKRHNVSSLVRAMSRLAKLDEDVKGPCPSKRTLLELAVTSIS